MLGNKTTVLYANNLLLVIKMKNNLKLILDSITTSGGNPYLVGGCVRDEILGIKNSKDIDVEVYGLSADELITVLKPFGKVDCVGVSFGVIKLTTPDDDFDFTLPRRDSKVADGHQGFTVEVDHNMTITEAASRRDFTINSISKDCDGNLFDPFGGVEDLKNRVLRATSDKFAQDPLRTLRGFQFASRFNLTVDPSTSLMCKSLLSEAHTISTERIYGEVLKWALKSVKPSAGLYFLRDTKWIELFPELHALVGLPQDAEWHPEGDCLTHTSLVCDAARDIAVRDKLNDDDRLVLMLAALCHDLGKANTTVMRDERWRSPGHAEEGADLTRSLLARMGFGESVVKKVVPLVVEHMSHIGVEPNNRLVRRLAVRVAPSNIAMLVRLIEADHSGRHPLPKGVPATAAKIQELSEGLDLMTGKPDPIVKGRHLVAMEMEPGPKFKDILDRCYQAQLDGEFHTLEDGLALV